MIKFAALSMLLSLAPAQALAAPPDWVISEGRGAYPETAFFTGFGEALLADDQGRCKELARDNAKRALTQSIQVTVTSVGRSRAEQSGRDYAEFVSAMTESVSRLEIAGLKVETHLDAKKDRCYALASVEKAALARSHAAKCAALRGEILAAAETAKGREAKGDRNGALEDYLEARSKLEQHREAAGVAVLAGGTVSEEGLPSAANLRLAVARLAEKPVKTVDDAAWLLAYSLKTQAAAGGKVMVLPFTVRDTRMGSPFSRYLKGVLEARLADTAKWTVVEPRAASAGAERVLTGSYWPAEDGYKLIAKLRRVADGTIAASAEVSVPAAAAAAAKLSVEPENYQAALADQRVFGEGELQGGGLQLEAWTNKGSDGLMFSRGEAMKVFVRANLPGYVRFIYHLADGRRALLLDNYYLDASKVNMAYELPQEFECDAPFGAETLQAFLSTEKFEPLKTRSEGGYDILEEELAQALVKTRGMKAAKSAARKAEARLVLTTTEK